MVSNNNINFGMKVPTRQVVGLASKNALYQTHFQDKVDLIHKFISNKVNIEDRGGIGIVETFHAVSDALLKKFPDLKPFAEKISRAVTKDEDWNLRLINHIMADAEKKLGKELDVSTKMIEDAVGVTSNPLCKFVDTVL